MEYFNEMEVVFDSRSENEGFARVAVAAFMTQMDPVLEEVADVKTAVSEAVTNSIIHGYEGRTSGKITVWCGIEKDKKTKQNKTLCPHPKLSCFLLLIFFNHKCTQPAPKCHSGKQKQICSTAPRIENERKYEQYNIFLTNRLYRIVTDKV